MTKHEQRVAAWQLGIQDRNPEIRHMVIRQIGECGATAEGRDGVPMLLEALKSSNRETHELALFTLAKVAFDSDAALDGVMRVYREGHRIFCWGLAEMAKAAGPKATRLMPLMLEILEEANRTGPGFYHDTLIDAIGALGPAAPPEALSLLNDAMYANSHWDERVNYAAITALRRMGASGAEYLLRAATDEQCPSFVRWQVIESLGELPNEAARVVPILLQLVRTDKWSETAVEALGKLGPAARPAAGTLLRLLNKENASQEVRAKVAHAVWCICGNTTFVLPATLKLLETRPRGDAFIFLVKTCAAIGPPAIEAVPRLREFLHDVELREENRTLAAVALWRITGSYDGPLAELERHVSEHAFCWSPEIRDWAEQALSQLRGNQCGV